jgi:predicted nuclease of predicted toxin-antitoxin system
MKILVDMNLSPDWIEFLNNSEILAIHWSAIGAATAPDSEIMAYAASNDYVVLTRDLDFSTILAVTHGSKPSVALIRAGDLSLSAIGRQVLSALLQMRSELVEGALIVIDPVRTRIRLLPLRSSS